MKTKTHGYAKMIREEQKHEKFTIHSRNSNLSKNNQFNNPKNFALIRCTSPQFWPFGLLTPTQTKTEYLRAKSLHSISAKGACRTSRRHHEENARHFAPCHFAPFLNLQIASSQFYRACPNPNLKP